MASISLWSVVIFAGLHCCCSVEVDDAVFQQIHKRLENLETRNKYLEDKVQALEHKQRRQSFYEGPVTFTARIDKAVVDHVQSQQTVVFPTTVTQFGGGYNNATGVFTAPLSGIYLFTCSLMDSFARQDGSGAMLHAEILLNGNVLGRVFAHAESSLYRDQGAQTVFADVQKGDTIWIRSVDNNDLTIGGEKYSTFSGYLLWQM